MYTPKHRKKEINKMDVILIFVFICLVIFTIVMIDCFKKQYAIPDTLVTCVYATLGGECGILGWIKTTKTKHEERKWQLEDEERITNRMKEEKGK